MNVALVTLNAKYIHSSLALRYLKEVCKDICEIKIKEFTINNQPLEILGQIHEEKPEVVAFACYIWNIEMVKTVIGLLKRVSPEVRVICGGPEVSYRPEEFLRQAAGVDYIVRGEGEETLRALLLHLHGHVPRQNLSGVSYRDANGRIHTGEAAVVRDLDRLPFPYRAEEMSALKDKIIYYESSRGCPFSCQYCLSSATEGVRFLRVERVLEELAFFIRHDVRQVKFVDRTFNAKKSAYLPILKFLARQDCRTNFHFEVAADLLDEEALDVLRTMPKGRVQLEIGVQSTNAATLEKIRRKNHWEKIVRNVTRLLSFGNIHLHLDLIIGLPEEDYRSFGNSFNDVYRLRPHMLQIGFLKLLKGSGIAQNAQAYDYVFMDAAPYQVLANRFINYEEMRRLQIFEGVFEQYYNSGRFQHALRCLIERMEDDAFAFYEAFTAFWFRRGFHLVAHTAKSLYAHLDAFCAERFPEHKTVFRQLLKFDALLFDRGGIRPAFLDWNEDAFYAETSRFWRSEIAGKYLPGYQFTNWRALKKVYHIEVFSIDPIRWRESGRIVHAQTPILFKLTEDPATAIPINGDDFRQGEN